MARDGQSTALQATVIVLTMLVVGLGVGTWLGYSEATKATARANAAEESARTADQRIADFNYAVAAYKHMVIGSPERSGVDAAKGVAERGKGDPTSDAAETDATAALAQFDQNMKLYTDVAPEGGRDYTKLIAFAMKTISERNKDVADARTRDVANAENLKQTQASELNRAKMAEDRAGKAESDLKGERDKMEADRARYKEDTKKLEAEKVAAVDQKDKELKQARDENAGLKKLNQQLQEKNVDLLAKVKKLDQYERPDYSQAQYEIADGELTAVSQREQLVWLNLGSADGLRPQMTFSVFAHDENRNTVDRMKGTIEVTKIHGPHLAEARINQPESAAEKKRLFTEPLLPGDKLFNPGWSPGQVLHFAIAGFIDTNGDGRSDRDRVRSILESAGAVIDAEVMDDGKRVGSPSVVTRYFIRGKDPRDTRIPGQSEDEAKAASQAYGDMVRLCENYNVEQIDVSKFLAMMGWKEEQRTTALGARRDASKFRPRKPSDAAAPPPAAKPAGKPATEDAPAEEGGDTDPFGS